MISTSLRAQIHALPHAPGVYIFYDAAGTRMYVGKATSLRSRVGSYFQKTTHAPTRSVEEIISRVARIQHIETPTVIEAVFKEAELIRTHKPPYNVLLKDDKSFLWVCFTADEYPRVVLVRGNELAALGDRATRMYPKRWGPFTSARLVRAGLAVVRTTFPWSDCVPGKKRPCFNAQLGRCPGVCVRAISSARYKKMLRLLELFLNGKRDVLEKKIHRAMEIASRAKHFERALDLRNQLFSLRHIADIALIGEMARDETRRAIVATHPTAATHGAWGRVEGYDISHFGGAGMVASMVVFEHGESHKSAYRKFSIRGFSKSNDTGALRETIMRRVRHREWPLPEIFFVDGGEAQVSAVRAVLHSARIKIPVVGIAKGPTRKNVRFVYDRRDVALDRAVRLYPHIFVRVRDEAHRFAITYQRVRRAVSR